MLKFRVDDFPGTKPQEFHRHNLQSFLKFHEVMKSYGRDYSLGVIPKYTTETHLGVLSDLHRSAEIDVVLHGISHDESRLNEFEGLERRQIVDLIEDVLIQWEDDFGIEVGSYIPPHNVLDGNTIAALDVANMRMVFTGPGTRKEDLSMIVDVGMKYAHSIDRLSYGRTDELISSGAIKFLKKMNEDVETHWVTLHLPWETNIGLNSLKCFLEELKG